MYLVFITLYFIQQIMSQTWQIITAIESIKITGGNRVVD